jgi:hypothetical protein
VETKTKEYGLFFVFLDIGKRVWAVLFFYLKTTFNWFRKKYFGVLRKFGKIEHKVCDCEKNIGK